MTTWLDLGPHETQTFQWGLIAVDECNGSQLTLYTTSITASPSQTILTDSRTITIPGSHPLMLYTVSLAPVRAASRGLVVTPSSTRCPG